MPINEKRMGQIIRGECQVIEERCDGYKEKLVQVIVDILVVEQGHRIKATNIQQQINDICQAAGDFLMDQQNLLKSARQEIQ